jgi:HD-GYP domain-containing protein (c-di-GMP phosphodiesterase class II)
MLRLLSILLLWAGSLSQGAAPQVRQGVLDARAWDFRSGSLRLDGNWHFQEGMELEPSRAAVQRFTRIPGSWGENTAADTGLKMATYRLTLLLPPDVPPLLAMRPIRPSSHALQVSLDGVFQGGLGHFGASRLSSCPVFTSRPVFLRVSPGRHELLVEAAHFHLFYKGITRPLELGEASEVVREDERYRGFNDFLAGSLCVLALQFAILWWNRRRDLATGLFSLICLFSLARHLATTGNSVSELLPGFGWLGHLRLEYITFGTIILWVYWFSMELFPREFSRKPLYFLQISGIVYSFFVLAATPQLIVQSVWYYQVVHMVLISYATTRLALAAHRRREGAWLYLFGFAVLAGTVVNDILYAWGTIHTGLWSPAGMLALVVSLSILTARRSSHAFLVMEGGLESRLFRLAAQWEECHDGFRSHQRRVAEMAERLAKSLGMGADRVDRIRRAAGIHDAGMNSVPREILLFPGPLDSDSQEILRRHVSLSPQEGLLEEVDEEAYIVDHHHEHWDGSGYPQGLLGEAIPLEARIVAVADMWDALRHERPYRPAFGQAEAIEILQRERGRSLDPSLLDLFLEGRLWETPDR